MKTITINVYEFSELEDYAQEKAIKDYREYLIEYGAIWDLIGLESEEIRKDLEDIGLKYVNVFYDIDYHQGAGAVFNAEVSNYTKLFSEIGLNEKDFPEDIKMSFKDMSARYCHKGTVEVEVTSSMSEEENEKLRKTIEKWREEKCDYILSRLREYYDALISEENIKNELALQDAIMYYENGQKYDDVQ